MRVLTLFSFLMTFFLISACSQSSSEPPLIVTGGEEVNIVFEDEVSSLNEEDYKDMTTEAIELSEEHSIYNEKVKKWIIRYYIQNEEMQQRWTEDEIIKLSKDRVEFEEAWKDYAYLQYGVTITEEAIESQVEYNLEVYRNHLPPAIQGISKGLDISLEEYLREFDRDHVERTVLWQKLMPILLEKHRNESSERLDGVYLGERYEEEVRKYMETK
ncbi:hypothetical protein [Evansella halocellulosilytica]|uniref:hypothetical protein n=1 Tax=Evansella halocellulosilytica TaxID=2011013 RepID=UPI000BB8D433|nr:hypothetical protein [Evansella halocellulosilytica]